VLFDDLGGDWPRHDCMRSWAGRLERHPRPDGATAVRVATRVDVIRLAEPGETATAHALGVRNIDWTAPIEAMLPPPRGSEIVCGVVRELVARRDPHRELDIAPGSIGARSFGPVTDGPVGQVTVHQPSPEPDGPLESFTTYVEHELLFQVGRGNTVVAELRAVTGLSGQTVWWCDDLFAL
jgi:hypothetical protein